MQETNDSKSHSQSVTNENRGHDLESLSRAHSLAWADQALLTASSYALPA